MPDALRARLDALWNRLGDDERVVRWTYSPRAGLSEQALADLEQRAGITLAPALRNLYRDLDGAHLEWTAPLPLLFDDVPFDDRAAVGLIELLPATETFLPSDDAPAPWHGALYGDGWGWPEGDAEAQDAMQAFRPIDWFFPDASACVGVCVQPDGHVPADLYTYTADFARPVPLHLDLEAYLTFLVATGGLLGGRAFLHTGAHADFLRALGALFPETTPEEWAPSG